MIRHGKKAEVSVAATSTFRAGGRGLIFLSASIDRGIVVSCEKSAAVVGILGIDLLEV